MDTAPPPRDIRCFVLVARHRGFSRAAAELGLSQPAVSQAIARLERAYRLRLFDRTSRDVELTDAGRQLLSQAVALLDAVAAFDEEAARIAVPRGRAIRLAYCPLVGALAARVARRLGAGKPAVDVDLAVAGWAAATAELQTGRAAAALMCTPFPPGLAQAARFQVPVAHLAVPSASPLASAGRLSPDQLGRYELLLPRHRPPGSVWAQLSARLSGPDQPRLVSADLDNLTAGLDLVAAGRGLLPAPHLLVETVRRPDVRFVAFDVGELRMTYGLVWSPDSATAELMALVQAVKEVLRVRSLR